MPPAPLRPEDLVAEFGRGAPLTGPSVQSLLAALADSSLARSALEDWKTLVNNACGRDLAQPSAALERLAKLYGLPPRTVGPEELLFALQSYYALLVRLLVRQVLPGVRDEQLLAEDPLDWPLRASSPELVDQVAALTERVAQFRGISAGESVPSHDWFKPLYQNLFPGEVRHALGEYYTPRWLAEHLLDTIGYTSESPGRLLDPACGSGTFLLAALDRLRQQSGNPSDRLATIFDRIAGFDLNPVAVLSARANYLLAVADLLGRGSPPPLPIRLRDSILDPLDEEAFPRRWQFVVGNPPWIAWDSLPAAYRQVTKPLWQQYGLFSLSATAARHGGAKKDLAMLMLYVAADRYLEEGGRLGMVITQTVLQSKGAGDGFRRFQLGAAGPALEVLRVDDLSRFQPFADASNWTATLVLRKGTPTMYPVPYWKWSRKGALPQEDGPADGAFAQHACRAAPIDPQRPSSPWLILPDGLGPSAERLVGPSDYQAHLGVNSGGANGVYWLELLAAAEDGVRVRNLVGRGKQQVPPVETVIERDLLYPLLRWADVDRYAAQPRAHVLLAQDVLRRRGLEREELAARWPRTLAYLEQFESLLRRRSAYRRYQQEAPFWSMYNVGPYSLAPWKVVWRRMDRQVRAAVVGTLDDPLLGPRPVLPQETCVLIAVDNSDEAFYLCALLNSAVVDFLVHAHSVRGGKGFGTPSMLDYAQLKRFRPHDPAHRSLATLAREAHQRAQAGQTLADLQEEIDQRTGRLWSLTCAELDSLRSEAQ